MDRQALVKQFEVVRAGTRNLCEPLLVGDYEAQSMPDCSPIKWHLGHTAWFFEAFVLRPYDDAARLFHPEFPFLFNSYYNAEGARHGRSERGLLCRPPLEDVLAYRRFVEERVTTLLGTTQDPEVLERVLLGCHHEQQHQELMLTDIKHLFSRNPLKPVYQSPHAAQKQSGNRPEYPAWYRVKAGVYEIGFCKEAAELRHCPGELPFAYDNESPRHRVFLEPYLLARDVVTNGEFLRFVEDDGYRRPELWLDAGYRQVVDSGWSGPLYWRRTDEGELKEFTLQGERPLNLDEPVCHVSYFEADAYARWCGARLPREAEWEVAVQLAANQMGEETPTVAFPVESDVQRVRHPQPPGAAPLSQVFGDVWQWTQSAYCAYPGYRPQEGALGEYNGKFMCGQFVLRGGSCASSDNHSRATYRNFFYPPDRWQVSGIRLARDA